MSEYPVYWCRIKTKVRPCALVERGVKKAKVMFISSSLFSDTKITFFSKAGKIYKGYLHKGMKIINISQILRFISKVEA